MQLKETTKNNGRGNTYLYTICVSIVYFSGK